MSGLTRVAPIGTPPAIPFARHKISGAVFQWSHAQSRPVLPNPACISSKIRRIPFSLQSFLTSCKNPSGATLIPLSPCIGSKITNAVSSSIVERRDSISPNDAKETFSTNGSNAFLYFGLNVNDNAPSDYP